MLKAKKYRNFKKQGKYLSVLRKIIFFMLDLEEKMLAFKLLLSLESKISCFQVSTVRLSASIESKQNLKRRKTPIRAESLIHGCL